MSEKTPRSRRAKAAPVNPETPAVVPAVEPEVGGVVTEAVAAAPVEAPEPVTPEAEVVVAAESAPAEADKPAKAAKAVKAAKSSKVEKPAKAEKPVKARKVQLVRDSFTMPEDEYALLAQLKKRLLAQAVEAKKSEVLRAGVALLNSLSDADLVAALQRVEVLKTGRPAKAA
ncbi:MAG: hypothetical protein RIR00_1016 [Pseudomonadota bacterium]|jgi:hypothetical protein